jgi:hypothetical protein
VQSLKLSGIAVICFFVSAFLIVGAVRKITYSLYNWFPSAKRVYEFQWQRELKFYWSRKADFSTIQLVRLYALWIIARFDKCFPVIDCDWQATKAQYFHESGRSSRLRLHRYINPKSWPVLFVRRSLSPLFPSFFCPRNKVSGQLGKQSASHEYREIR